LALSKQPTIEYPMMTLGAFLKVSFANSSKNPASLNLAVIVATLS
jgi:hypothetical protein